MSSNKPLFRIEFNRFNNIGERMLGSIYLFNHTGWSWISINNYVFGSSDECTWTYYRWK